jgi:hypothetical protein
MILPIVICGCEIWSLTCIKGTCIEAVTEQGAEENSWTGAEGSKIGG